MGSNWAEEFRRRIEESEGKYRPAENLDDVDEEEWEEKEEEDAEFEESEDEAEEVEQEGEGEEEAEEVEQKSEESEVEKPFPEPVVDVRERTAELMDTMLGKKPAKVEPKTNQASKTEVTKAEPAKREANEWAGVGAAMMGLMLLSLMPTFYQTMTQAFQPFIRSFQSLSGRSYGTLATSQQWVTCPYCGYQCLGYNGMPCPRCRRI